MAVFYKCKICGEQHKANMNLHDKLAFERTDIKPADFTCEMRWKMATYDKSELFWVEGDK